MAKFAWLCYGVATSTVADVGDAPGFRTRRSPKQVGREVLHPGLPLCHPDGFQRGQPLFLEPLLMTSGLPTMTTSGQWCFKIVAALDERDPVLTVRFIGDTSPLPIN